MRTSFFPTLVGNDAVKEKLGKEIQTSSLSHALILDGKPGSGRHTLAYAVAAALSCREGTDHLPCGRCPSCEKILAGKSPDLITVGKSSEKASVGIEAIRSLKNDVVIPPNDTDYKIYLIENAENLTVQAQNAFLLTLEEPPAYVLFILLCDGADRLLETVRSRAPIFRMQPLGAETVLTYLRAAKPTVSPSLCEAAAHACDGRIGEALALLDRDAGEELLRRRAGVEQFFSLVAGSDRAALLSHINSLGNKRDEIVTFFNDCLLAVRDMILVKKTDLIDADAFCFFASADDARRIADRFPARFFFLLNDRLTSLKESLARNANVRLTLTQLLLCVWNTKA